MFKDLVNTNLRNSDYIYLVSRIYYEIGLGGKVVRDIVVILKVLN